MTYIYIYKYIIVNCKCKMFFNVLPCTTIYYLKKRKLAWLKELQNPSVLAYFLQELQPIRVWRAHYSWAPLNPADPVRIQGGHGAKTADYTPRDDSSLVGWMMQLLETLESRMRIMDHQLQMFHRFSIGFPLVFHKCSKSSPWVFLCFRLCKRLTQPRKGPVTGRPTTAPWRPRGTQRSGQRRPPWRCPWANGRCPGMRSAMQEPIDFRSFYDDLMVTLW